MFLNSLHLKDFRNFANLDLDFGPQFNLFVGKNAQGKTNIVEAIGLLALGRSFRTQEFRDMIRRDCESSHVKSASTGSIGTDDLSITLDLSRKTFFKNAKKTTPGEFSGLGAVLFAPEEILLLRDSPSARRRYIDTLISQIIPTYRGLIRKYDRVVSHRNRLLQDAMISEVALDRELAVWDEQLTKLGAEVIVRRNESCVRLNEFLPGKYEAIAPKDGEAKFKYKPHCGTEALSDGQNFIEKVLLNQIKARKRDERVRGITLVGPHRDDLEAEIGNAAVKHFGSQGQHRSFVLALKIAETELLRATLGETPILLLDDVASELDTDRNKFFFDYLNAVKGQVFVTATDANDIKLGKNAETKWFNVAEGKVVCKIPSPLVGEG